MLRGRVVLSLVGFVAAAAAASIASAEGIHTFTFDPNVIIDSYAPTAGDNVTVTRVNQPEARRLYGVPLYNGNVSTGRGDSRFHALAGPDVGIYQ